MRVTTQEQGATLLKSIEGEVKVCVSRPMAETIAPGPGAQMMPSPDGVQLPSISVQLPTEQTYTFHKATAETVCGISLLNGLKAGQHVVFIESLNAGGAAGGSGLEVGDAVCSINGIRVTTQEQGVTLLKSIKGEVKVCVTRH